MTMLDIFEIVFITAVVIIGFGGIVFVVTKKKIIITFNGVKGRLELPTSGL